MQNIKILAQDLEMVFDGKRTLNKVSFDVLYYAVELTPTLIEKELGEKEGEFIRANMPVLNT